MDTNTLDAPPVTPSRTSNELATERTDLAVERTRIAHERTLMAWIRTSTSMISFGFAIYKFFQEMADKEGAGQRAVGPRELAMMLAGVGTAALLLAMWQHTQYMRALGTPGTGRRIDVAFAVGCLIAAMGALTFAAIALHV